MKLEKKVVVILGASSGIGLACAKLFAKKKSYLVLVARRKERLLRIAEHLSSKTKVLVIPADITKKDQLTRVFEEIKKTFKQIDVLINNAGMGIPGSLSEIKDYDWDAQFNLNVKAVMHACQYALPLMKKGSHIISVASIAGLYSRANYSVYCASKHAVIGFLRSIRFELFLKGIRVSWICPARVETEFFKYYTKRPPQWHLLPAKDVAQVIVTYAEKNFLKRCYFRLRNLLKRIFKLFFFWY